LAQPLRSSRAAAPDIGAAGSNDADSGDRCEESEPALNANPGYCCVESALPAPENNPIRIASAQTTLAVIHAIRTATRPVNLALSDVLFTVTAVWSRYRILGPGDRCPGAG
jgi:hypothetical protein